MFAFTYALGVAIGLTPLWAGCPSPLDTAAYLKAVLP